ncbi:MAG: hypothetical protein LBD06_00860 [Candidatus Accumulibacter sp.]|nr:hypothetical protein [Accumulibacter sp.]
MREVQRALRDIDPGKFLGDGSIHFHAPSLQKCGLTSPGHRSGSCEKTGGTLLTLTRALCPKDRRQRNRALGFSSLSGVKLPQADP